MASIENKLVEFVTRLKAAAGANLQSVILYGSTARGETHEKYSDVNILCVFQTLHAPDLAKLSPVVTWWLDKQKEPAPLLFTMEELRESADVFAIEFLDMKESHRVIHGADVIADVTVPMNLHRVQVEHELRSAVLKLRMHFLRRAGDAKALYEILADSYASVLTLLRHSLIALGEEPADAPRDVFSRLAAIAGVDALAFEPGLVSREAGKLQRDATAEYGEYLAALEKVIGVLDKHLPKKEWKRSGAHS